jgi:hypothetical protein
MMESNIATLGQEMALFVFLFFAGAAIVGGMNWLLRKHAAFHLGDED